MAGGRRLLSAEVRWSTLSSTEVRRALTKCDLNHIAEPMYNLNQLASLANGHRGR